MTHMARGELCITCPGRKGRRSEVAGGCMNYSVSPLLSSPSFPPPRGTVKKSACSSFAFRARESGILNHSLDESSSSSYVTRKRRRRQRKSSSSHRKKMGLRALEKARLKWGPKLDGGSPSHRCNQRMSSARDNRRSIMLV